MAIDVNKYNSENKYTWCPGCGNFAIHIALKKALSELNISPSETFISFDIGCNGNGGDKINTYAFKGLHGRSIPLAIGAHLANRKFSVFADIGDGGCFHEGLDHLVHAIRCNYDITILIHNNQNFALTTGQATVTTQEKKPMYGSPNGRSERELNISEFILNLKPSLYAKGYTGNPIQLTDLIKQGIKNKGCSVIEIIQMCPTYNKEFTPQWAREHIKEISSLKKHNKESLEKAREIVNEKDIYTGIIYKNSKITPYYKQQESRKDSLTELVEEVKPYNIKKLIKYLE